MATREHKTGKRTGKTTARKSQHSAKATRKSRATRTNTRDKGYGWIPDIPDQRDFLYAAPPAFLRALPEKVDLRAQCPPIYDQGQLGSCTANAIGGAVEFDQMKEKLPQVFVPSRLFIYYNERVLEGSVNSDSGAMLRDGIKTIAKQGACPETIWPYVIAKFKIKPSPGCYAEAAKHIAVSYQRLVQSLPQMQGCLASGYPFVFGFTVYESFESYEVSRTGHAPMPASRERVLGGHAVCAVGYDDAKRWFICRNSWGTNWGMRGYFTIPYGYLSNPDLAADFWTIRAVQ
jgi:C1A family cysteine protease